MDRFRVLGLGYLFAGAAAGYFAIIRDMTAVCLVTIAIVAIVVGQALVTDE